VVVIVSGDFEVFLSPLSLCGFYVLAFPFCNVGDVCFVLRYFGLVRFAFENA
jgi:hypothetical protein